MGFFIDPLINTNFLPNDAMPRKSELQASTPREFEKFDLMSWKLRNMSFTSSGVLSSQPGAHCGCHVSQYGTMVGTSEAVDLKSLGAMLLWKASVSSVKINHHFTPIVKQHSPMIFPMIFPYMAIFLVEIPAEARHAILLWLHGFVSRQNRWICFGQPQGPTGWDSTNRL